MTNPALPGGPSVTRGAVPPPPMPSISASALDESLRLLARTRRVIAALLTRG